MEQKSVGEYTVTLKADTAELNKQIDEVQGKLEDFENRVDRIIVKLIKLSALAAALLVDTDE